MEQVKKYGEYFVNVDLQWLQSACEFEVWDTIRIMKEELRCNKADPMLGRSLSSTRVVNYEYDLNYLIYYTRNYGVEFDCEPSEKPIVENESFNKWYDFYDKHMRSMIHDGSFAEYLKDQKAHNNLDKYMPTTSWKEHTR